MIKGYDNWKLDTHDNHVKVIGHCEHCEWEIYEGEEFVDFSEGIFHTDCWWEYEDEQLYEEE